MEDHPSATAPLYDVDRITGRAIEAFYADDKLALSLGGEPGWYWWSCLPGCLPDGGAFGPFGSAYLAFKDATLAQFVGAASRLHPGPFGRRSQSRPMNEKAAR
jgi:hypothetical protein